MKKDDWNTMWGELYEMRWIFLGLLMAIVFAFIIWQNL